MTGPAKEIAAKACNKMKCKTHGEVSGCATQKQADSERTDAGSSKKATSVVVTLSIPKPCQVRSYDTSVRIMSRVDAFGRRQNHEPQPTPRSDGRSCRSLSTQGMRHSACDDLEVGEIYKYYCDDHLRSTLTRYRRYLFP
jgi:hypothetical protein